LTTELFVGLNQNMKFKNKTLVMSVIIMLFSNMVFGQTAALEDINYNFDQTKVEASKDSFHFLRSFVDYYFGVIAKNSNSLHTAKIAGGLGGWCVGDAHAENFGVLLQEKFGALIQSGNSVLFTMNDMDDSGPCPVVYDILRLIVSSRLYLPGIDTQELLKSYTDGLTGKRATAPNAIDSMTKDALKAGLEISPKNLNGKLLKQKSEMNEVDTSTRAIITSQLQEAYKDENLIILDMLSTMKVGGGSGGLLRFEILITNDKKQMIHLELKELVTPSIAPVASTTIPDQGQRIQKTLEIVQGKEFSHYYNVLVIQDKKMLLRPKFSGNLRLSLSDFSDKVNLEIINFEAYVLGGIHANSVDVGSYLNMLNSISPKDWEDDISSFVNLFNKKFSELKH